jgi:hypothetical protein
MLGIEREQGFLVTDVLCHTNMWVQKPKKNKFPLHAFTVYAKVFNFIPKIPFVSVCVCVFNINN